MRLCAQVWLIYGRSGWIGGLVGDILKAQGAKYEYGTARLEDRAAILADIERVRAGAWAPEARTAPRSTLPVASVRREARLRV